MFSHKHRLAHNSVNNSAYNSKVIAIIIAFGSPPIKLEGREYGSSTSTTIPHALEMNARASANGHKSVPIFHKTMVASTFTVFEVSWFKQILYCSNLVSQH